MNKTLIVVSTVKEMYNERKFNFDFSLVINWEDVDKTNEIVAVNDRLQ